MLFLISKIKIFELDKLYIYIISRYIYSLTSNERYVTMEELINKNLKYQSLNLNGVLIIRQVLVCLKADSSLGCRTVALVGISEGIGVLFLNS